MRHEIVGTAPDTDPGFTLTERVAAARSVLADNAEKLAAVTERLRSTRSSLASGRSRREQLHESAYARLRAQLETMPVIEQAKGVLMAENRCGPEEAFDLLRRASQRANIKISVLAEQVRSPDHQPSGTFGNGRKVR